ncbi:MAG: DUF569 domain-containing protein [Bacteroidia bacterium]|nr:DUF569 domain-containing protein [Bacteroidia bacterium]
MKQKAFLLLVLAGVFALTGFSQEPAKTGKTIQLKSYHEKFVTADQDKGNQLFADRNNAGTLETFTMIDQGDGKIALKGSNGKYVSVDPKTGLLYARSIIVQDWEKFTLVKISEEWVAFKANNGKFVSADKDNKLILIANRDSVKEWESFMMITK